MLLLNSYKNVRNIVPIIRFELYNKESCFLIKTNLVVEILTVFKNHFSFQFKILTCISGVDYPENFHRFQVVYELLSIRYNKRIRIKLLANELSPVNTVENIYSAATWWEAEIWDMFGIFFINQYNLIRLLTDYGFQGYPLRKDFPLTGFLEFKFNFSKNKVSYERIKLSSEYRIFKYGDPWGEVKLKPSNPH